MTTELLDQAIQTLSNLGVPVGQLESIGVPVFKALGSLIAFRKQLLENPDKNDEAGEIDEAGEQ